MDWAAVAQRQRERADGAQGPVLRGNAAYGEGLAHLMLGEREAAREALDRAVAACRESWAEAPPDAWGRPIAALKARVLAGEDASAEARWALDAGAAQAPTAIGRYAAALACLVLGDDDAARLHADAVRIDPEFPAEVGDALATIAAGTDAVGYVEALERVLESFERRDAYLEEVAVADTVLVLRTLGEARGLRVDLASPLLPSG